MKWLLLCNPNEWFDKLENNMHVNKLLLNLGLKGSSYETELWKLNVNNSMKMDKRINDGDLGVIKVSVDRRTKKTRTSKNGEIEEKLESGIYAIFKFVSTDFNPLIPKISTDEISRDECIQISELLWKNNNGTIYGKIEVINNFFRDSKIIIKDEAIKIMGKNLFEFRGARDISDKVFNELVNFNKSSKMYIEDLDSKYQKDIHDVILPKNKIEDKPEYKKHISKQSKNSKYNRSKVYAKSALKEASFKCELDKNHKTFKSKSLNENYVEAHHLIPMNLYKDFEFSLDVHANIVSLCPNCHRMLHFGLVDDINQALEVLYKQRSGRLKSVNLDITLDELKKMYL